MKQEITKAKDTGIKDINKIKAQYDAGVSILSLSKLWDIPYATLYRALKELEAVAGRSTGKE